MCDSGQSHNVEAQALCFLRFFVYREYREIRYLGNPQFGRYDKFSACYSDLFELSRAAFASLWHSVASEKDIPSILKPFELRTGLTLEDVEEAFRHGEWSPFGSAMVNYGGPKHADIVSSTIRLRNAMATASWTDVVPQELAALKKIQHNRPRPARLDYSSLLEDLKSLKLQAPPGTCCLLDSP